MLCILFATTGFFPQSSSIFRSYNRSASVKPSLTFHQIPDHNKWNNANVFENFYTDLFVNQTRKTNAAIKTSTHKKYRTEKKRQTLRARFSQTKANFKKIKHGFFFQVGQLDNPETVWRNLWRSGRNIQFFGASFLPPREEKRNLS